MLDSFTYAAYRALVGRLARTHALLRFVDVKDGLPAQPFVILRHDVDYSPRAALELAKLEAAEGWRSTYFLLPSGPYYNLLEPETASLPRQLVDLGHEVGLHYDVRLLRVLPAHDGDRLLEAQVDLLISLGVPHVVSIARHQPALTGEDPFGLRTDYLNAYHPRFIRDMTYVSDSCRAWRDAAWQLLAEGPLPDRLQLLLHPVNWAQADRSREEIFAGVRRDFILRFDASHAELLEKIAAHAGVKEHESRLTRQGSLPGRC